MTKHKRLFKNFKAACEHYRFPGSHQVGSYGPKGKGIVRSYSNGTPGKDIIHEKEGQKTIVEYKLKDERYRDKFTENMKLSSKVHFFRKVEDGCEDLGMFKVLGFTESGRVKMVSTDNDP